MNKHLLALKALDQAKISYTLDVTGIIWGSTKDKEKGEKILEEYGV